MGYCINKKREKKFIKASTSAVQLPLVAGRALVVVMVVVFLVLLLLVFVLVLLHCCLGDELFEDEVIALLLSGSCGLVPN